VVINLEISYDLTPIAGDVKLEVEEKVYFQRNEAWKSIPHGPGC